MADPGPGEDGPLVAIDGRFHGARTEQPGTQEYNAAIEARKLKFDDSIVDLLSLQQLADMRWKPRLWRR